MFSLHHSAPPLQGESLAHRDADNYLKDLSSLFFTVSSYFTVNGQSRSEWTVLFDLHARIGFGG